MADTSRFSSNNWARQDALEYHTSKQMMQYQVIVNNQLCVWYYVGTPSLVKLMWWIHSRRSCEVSNAVYSGFPAQYAWHLRFLFWHRRTQRVLVLNSHNCLAFWVCKLWTIAWKSENKWLPGWLRAWHSNLLVNERNRSFSRLCRKGILILYSVALTP